MPHARRPLTAWDATAPPGVSLPGGPAPRAATRYTGPPSYAVVPAWGFPPVAWRRPLSVLGTPSAVTVSYLDRVRFVARHATAMLWLVAGLSSVAVGGEAWRYVLLLRSRNAVLSADVVAFSDALVAAASVLAMAVSALTTVTTVWWLYLARLAAVEVSGYRPSRADWQALVGVLAPGPNLVMAGSVLAELEHAVLRRPASRRPRPTRLVLSWWIAWAAGGVVLAITVLWRLRDGVQAQADGVVLTGVTDLAAVCVAVLTALVVRRLTTLLAPLDPASVRAMRVVRVSETTEPSRASRPAGAKR